MPGRRKYIAARIKSPGIGLRSRGSAGRRAVPQGGQPYLAHAAEEHSGPHEPWFWQANAGAAACSPT